MQPVNSDEIKDLLPDSSPTSSIIHSPQYYYYVQYPSSASPVDDEDYNDVEDDLYDTKPFSPPSSSDDSFSMSSSLMSPPYRMMDTWMPNYSDSRQFITREREERPDLYWNDRCGNCCRLLTGLVASLVLVSIFLIIFSLWSAASLKYAPDVYVKSFTGGIFHISEGVDWTGVPTELLHLNSSLTIRVRNPGNLGIHVSPMPVNLLYYNLVVASGQVPAYYQPRKSWKELTVDVGGNSVPLYGAGIEVAAAFKSRQLPLILNFTILSRANLVGHLVTIMHQRHVSCSMAVNITGVETFEFKEESCTRT